MLLMRTKARRAEDDGALSLLVDNLDLTSQLSDLSLIHI